MSGMYLTEITVKILFLRRAIPFLSWVVESRKNNQNEPKFSCGAHLLSEFCMLIGQLGKEKIHLIRDLNQSNIWRLCCFNVFHLE